MIGATFWNNSKLDIKAIELLGVSAKEEDNSIGRFGTGLKYAIAVTLRLGGTFELRIENEDYSFEAERVEIRGKEFFQVVMVCGNERRPLGFTTELGKHWEAWMVFRELFSNCKDEKGEFCTEYLSIEDVIEAEHFLSGRMPTTIVRISGSFLGDTLLNLKKYFIFNRKPIYENEWARVFRRGDRDTHSIFYQGILVGTDFDTGNLVFDIKKPIELSEDRFIKSSIDVSYALNAFLLCCDDKEIIRETLTEPPPSFFANTTFILIPSGVSVTESLKEEVRALQENPPHHFNHKIVRYLEDIGLQFSEGEEFVLDIFQRKQYERARKVVEALGYKKELAKLEIKFIKTLGQTIMGKAKGRTIYLAEESFIRGESYLASTLLEEFVHCHFGYLDYSVALQTWLFDRIVYLVQSKILTQE